jgi:hypothetical protein
MNSKHANIHGQVGSLTSLLEELTGNGITRFHSYEDISAFRQNYKKEIEEHVVSQGEILTGEIEDARMQAVELQAVYDELIEKRKVKLAEEFGRIDDFLSRDKSTLKAPVRFCYFLMSKYYNHRRKRLTDCYDDELSKPYKKRLQAINQLHDFISDSQSNFDRIVDERSRKFIDEINRTVSILKELNSLFYGVIGELKAVDELSELPSTYNIINDCKKTFVPPIYNRQENDHIYTIQADHIVVGPTGVFLIETKNWSRSSMYNLDLFSPVQQLKRTGFALFVFLNGLIRDRRIRSFHSNWGAKKLSLNNILLMVNATTSQQYQFVKILNLPGLNDYITRRPVVLNMEQVSDLTRVLLDE